MALKIFVQVSYLLCVFSGASLHSKPVQLCARAERPETDEAKAGVNAQFANNGAAHQYPPGNRPIRVIN